MGGFYLNEARSIDEDSQKAKIFIYLVDAKKMLMKFRIIWVFIVRPALKYWLKKLAIIYSVVSAGVREKKKERKGRNMMKLKDRSLAALMISYIALIPTIRDKIPPSK